MSFWDFLWFFFWTYIFISFIIILFQMFADLFRDRTLNGWAKALWIIFLVFVPFLGALIYLVVRGRGMAERQAARMMVAQSENDAYIRTVAASTPSLRVGDRRHREGEGSPGLRSDHPGRIRRPEGSRPQLMR